MKNPPTNLKFPSKTFLCGEYAVLYSGEALVLASAPFFSATISESAKKEICPFALNSEAGLYWQKEEAFFSRHKIEFQDPHQGLGGFGGSGAEFLSLYQYKNPEASPIEAFRSYQEIRGQRRSSGADILTQAAAKNKEALLTLQIKEEYVEALPWPGNSGYLLTLIHTGIKLPTHAHLQNLGEIPTAALDEITHVATQNFREKNISAFAENINYYGETLAKLGLLSTHSARIVESLKKEYLALAAKGCGAMGSDVVVALTKTSLPTDFFIKNNATKVREIQL